MDSAVTADDPAPRPCFEQTKAVLIGLALLVALLAASVPIFRLIERPVMGHLIALPLPEKNQGVFLQKEAFRRPDVLPVYGSSELTEDMEFRADEVFWHMPKGFQVCPVGTGGNTTLLMAEKIAALGDSGRGQKIVIILSPVWFRDHRPRADHVAGNFSPLQVISLLQNPALDDKMRRRFAERMLRFPTSLEGHRAIEERLRDLRSGGERHPWKDWLSQAELWMQGRMLAWEDRLNTLLAVYAYGINELGTWKHKPAKLALGKRIQRIEGARRVPPADDEPVDPTGPSAEASLSAMQNSEEWADFELLLDTLKALEAKPLIISLPMPAEFSSGRVITQETRAYYYSRIEAMSTARDFPALTFSDHDRDSDFMTGNTGHPTARGWLYVNHALDEFFHNRIGPPRRR
jgi:D-alanine transfer protein